MLTVTNKPFMLSVIMQNVVMLSVVVLYVVRLFLGRSSTFEKTARFAFSVGKKTNLMEATITDENIETIILN